jgi:hypothetical protein
VAASRPARQARSHASPSTPPPPRTRTSGRSIRRHCGRRRASADTSVRDNVRAYDGVRHRRGRPAREGAAGGREPVAARPRRALGRLRSHALAGRARRDQPHAPGRGADRGGLQLRLSQLLRLDEQDTVTIVRPGERRGRGRGRARYEVLTPPLPGQRAEVSRHTLAPGAATGGPGDPPMHEPGARETAIVESGALRLLIDGAVHALAAGDLRSRSTPTCRTTSRTTERRRRSCWPSCPRDCVAHERHHPCSTRSGPPTRWRRVSSTSTCTWCTR